MKNRTRWLTVTALGIALFVLFSLALRIPVFARFYLCLGYLVMGVYCYYFGILSGTLVGSLGVLIYCTIFSSFGGMIGWALGNAVIGVAMGFTAKKIRNLKTAWLRWVILLVTVVVSTAIGMLLIKSAYESLLSGLPFAVRVAANTAGFLADAAVLLLSIPLAESLRKVIFRQFGDLCA